MANGRDQPAMRRSSDVSKRDVELARLSVEREKLRLQCERWLHLGRALTGGVWILACTAPLWALQGVIEPLAGHATTVQANVVFSASLSVSVLVNVGQAIKGRSQRAEIERQRDRLTKLEAAGLKVPVL